MLLTISIILIIVSIIILIYGVYVIKHTHQINQDVDNQNQILEQKLKDLNNERNTLSTNLIIIQNNINEKQKQLENIQNNISKTLDNQKELSQKAFENYCEILEQHYNEKEQEYDMYEDALETAYSNLQLKLMKQADECRENLAQLEATRAAALQAKLKEKEIKEKLSFYCLTIKDSDLSDIKILEKIKPQLNNPRILSMLIWQTYFQKPMTLLCNNIIGTETKSGIYKITNQLDDLCYIGQSVDLASRWKDHAKCGLGIDTPKSNKLYQAMIEDGLWNFSFEVLEFCPREQLDEKEKYYIHLYQSKDYGYNSTIGNK